MCWALRETGSWRQPDSWCDRILRSSRLSVSGTCANPQFHLQAQLENGVREQPRCEDRPTFSEPEAPVRRGREVVEVLASVPHAGWVGEQFRLGNRNCCVVL